MRPQAGFGQQFFPELAAAECGVVHGARRLANGPHHAEVADRRAAGTSVALEELHIPAAARGRPGVSKTNDPRSDHGDARTKTASRGIESSTSRHGYRQAPWLTASVCGEDDVSPRLAVVGRWIRSRSCCGRCGRVFSSGSSQHSYADIRLGASKAQSPRPFAQFVTKIAKQTALLAVEAPVILRSEETQQDLPALARKVACPIRRASLKQCSAEFLPHLRAGCGLPR